MAPTCINLRTLAEKNISTRNATVPILSLRSVPASE